MRTTAGASAATATRSRKRITKQTPPRRGANGTDPADGAEVTTAPESTETGTETAQDAVATPNPEPAAEAAQNGTEAATQGKKTRGKKGAKADGDDAGTALVVQPEGTAVAALNDAESTINTILSAIPNMTDAELEEALRSTYQIERAAFVIRGAILAEKRKRTEKLSGGRGKKALEGQGIGAVAAEMAKETGRSANTLETDARIYETFKDELTIPVVAGDGSGKTTVEASPAALPREYYAVALTAGDEAKAHEAIEIAHAKHAAGGYSVKKFEQDVRALKGETPASEVEELYHLTHVALDKESRDALAALTARWGIPQQDAVRRAIIFAEKMTNVSDEEPDTIIEGSFAEDAPAETVVEPETVEPETTETEVPAEETQDTPETTEEPSGEPTESGEQTEEAPAE